MARIVWGNLVLIWMVAFSLTGCHVCRRDCQDAKFCYPEIVTEKVEHHGWEVKTEDICIPPIQCPFSDSCERRCGRLITVKKIHRDRVVCGECRVVSYTSIGARPRLEPDLPGSDDGTKPNPPIAAPAPDVP